MNDLLNDFLADDIIIVAFRVCNIIKSQKERITENIWDRLSDCLELGVKLAKEINEPYMMDYVEFTYIELISSTGEVFYIYDNKKAYEEYCNLSICKNLGVFKENEKKEYLSVDEEGMANVKALHNEDVIYMCDEDSNVQSIWKKKKKSYYKKMYPIEQLKNELQGKIYQLKDGCFSYEKGRFATPGLSFTPYGNIIDTTQKYNLDKEFNFIDIVKNTFENSEMDDRMVWVQYWEKIGASIRFSSKLIEDLETDFVKLRNDYKLAIQILNDKQNR